MHAFVIAGTNSGVGKTTVATCIAAALKKRGYDVQPFKVGPDFIDPTHYSFCNPAINLDAFMMGEDGVKLSFAKWMRNKDVAIIEGVMGLFDGYKLTDFSSTAHIAKLLNTPVILVMDVKATSLSALAIFEGFKNFDKEIDVAGVIFNNATGFHEKLKRVFENKGYKVFGVFPRVKDIEIKSRHLGLYLGIETKKDVNRLAELAESYLDIDGILEISEICIETEEEETFFAEKRIGIPFDEAFCFYYRDNLKILSRYGQLVFFSPLNDEIVECDAYYIGGGYPELHDFPKFLKFIRNEALDEKPIYGECGGLIALSRKIDMEKGTKRMANVLDIDIVFTNKLQALGYVRGEVVARNPFFQTEFRGHEFHYSYAIPDKDVKFAFKIDGKGIFNGFDGALAYKTLAGYSHIHFYSTKLKNFI